MALSHKDWELLNSRNLLAEDDIDRGLDFPIWATAQLIRANYNTVLTGIVALRP